MLSESQRRRIPMARPIVGALEKRYVLDALESGWISSIGPYIADFERAFADYCGVRHAITTFNGTVSLHLALRVLGVGAGDEVLVPALTFIAVPNAVQYEKATPVFIDCDSASWCVDPDQIEAAVSPRTKGIVAVHSYGFACPMDRIMAIAQRHSLFVIEDAAEAHGAAFDDRKVGSWGEFGSFSFYGNKILTTGEGGMLTTNDNALAERARFLKNHGMSMLRKYYHPEVGYNYRMTNLQAAVGLGQLEGLDEAIAIRDRLASRYRARLKAVRGVTIQQKNSRVRDVCWLFCLLVKPEFSCSRDELMEYLAIHGIESRPFFVPLHQQPPYAQSTAHYPVAEQLAREGLSLPCSVDLTTDDVDYICELIIRRADL